MPIIYNFLATLLCNDCRQKAVRKNRIKMNKVCVLPHLLFYFNPGRFQCFFLMLYGTTNPAFSYNFFRTLVNANLYAFHLTICLPYYLSVSIHPGKQQLFLHFLFFFLHFIFYSFMQNCRSKQRPSPAPYCKLRWMQVFPKE